MQCPTCGSDCWDNREKVAGGWKGPVWKCKDKDCAWVEWPPKGVAKKPASPEPMSARAGRWTWGQLSTYYGNAMKVARKHLMEQEPNATPAEVVAATATIFIAATRDGIIEKKVEADGGPELPY